MIKKKYSGYYVVSSGIDILKLKLNLHRPSESNRSPAVLENVWELVVLNRDKGPRAQPLFKLKESG